MSEIIVDFSKENGKVKPMHAVNNGPVYKFAEDQRITNMGHYQKAGIPFARNHDAAFYANYGGEHIVDVNFIFRDFDKDPYDPESYDFVLTDEYIKVTEFAGTRTFYRFGSKIEHWSKKYNTLPPKDFKKWAIICEHIIRHYTEGWANGFHYDIQYWEIWNEADLDSDDSKHKRCWGGTAKEFYELFNITLTHLKTQFPHLKIGGPAVAISKDGDWVNNFFKSLGEVKPDFFSWHIYAQNVEDIQYRIRVMKDMLNRYGLTNCESILNEWNYVKGWTGDEWIYSLEQMKKIKGAAFIAAVMAMSQNEELDMLMYYDARPCAMNGMFNTDIVAKCLKGYYPFYMFNQLYTQKTSVEASGNGDGLWACAAKGDEQNTMLAYFDNDDTAPSRDVKVTFKNVTNSGKVKLEYYLLDEDHNAELVREEIFTATEFSTYITMPRQSTYLFKIVAC